MDDLNRKKTTTAKTSREFDDAFRPIMHVDTTLYDPVREHWEEGSVQAGVRLYCAASPLAHGQENGRWPLQIRALVKTKSGATGKHFGIATASMSRKDLEWLRDQINSALRQKS
jgi:hypothetical protein